MFLAGCASLCSVAGRICDQALHWLFLGTAQIIGRPHQLETFLVARTPAISILGIIGLKALVAVVFDLFIIVFAHRLNFCGSQSRRILNSFLIRDLLMVDEHLL